jgi:hypothetical protein
MDSIEPGQVAQSQATNATILGHNFYAFASVELDGEQAGVIDNQWQVMVEGPMLSAAGVEIVNSTTIAFIVPAGLTLGLHDVTIVAPSGETDTLEDALMVVDDSALRLEIEDAPGGMGKAVGSPKVLLGESVELYSVGRDAQDASYLLDVDANWQVGGTVGSLAEVAGSATKFVANALGSAIVSADHDIYGQAMTGTITVVECLQDLDCAEVCRSANTCASDVCVEGPLDDACRGSMQASFQDGMNGYDDTVDTVITLVTPDLVLGTQAALSWQNVDSSLDAATLIRFDNIFGNGAGQVPYGSQIVSATLETQSLGGSLPDSGQASVVISPWTNQTTWNDFGATPGYNAEDIDGTFDTAPTSSLLCPCPRHSLDVTASVEAISKGAPNYGWIFMPRNFTFELISSSEESTIADRPRLNIMYVAPP